MRNLFLVSFFLLFGSALFSQSKKEKAIAEVNEALQLWNKTAKKADLNGFMNLFDDSENIMLVGSDSGEIYKGKEQISNWLGALFKHNSFEWDMKRVDIDLNEETAWVFADGFMIVTNSKGKKWQTPYRYSGVLVKHNNEWKWKLFDGSIPRSK